MVERVSLEKILDDLAAVVSDAERLLRATAHHTGEEVEEARARAEESVSHAKERLTGLDEHALESAETLASDADSFVRGNPWQAVGIAAGIGLVLGLLAARR